MKQVASCTPNVEDVQVITDTKSEWTLKVKIGPLSKKIKLVTETLASNPPTHAEFRGEGELVTTTGTIDLREISPQSTEVLYRVKAEGRGNLAGVLNNVIKSRMQSDVNEFEKRVRARLESG
jgi:carbon monoxide dehydrogenase subunit G